MKSLNRLFIILIAGTAITGCRKFVDVPLPITQLSTESAFSTDAKANSAMRGIYAGLVSGWVASPFTGAMTGNLGLSADELEKTSLTGEFPLFFENNLNASMNTINGALWGSFYSTIYQANNAITHIGNSKGIAPANKEFLTGEAHFLRALAYFYLVNMYDSVPLTTTADYRTNGLLFRESPEKVYEQIRQDLRYAQEKAGNQHTGTGFRARGNQWTATALLARVQLYTGNWEEAEAEATKVINAGFYKMGPLEETFLATSGEVILQLGNAGANLYTSEGSAITSSQVNPTYRFSTWLDAAFEPGDLRTDAWTRVGANGFRGPAKYKTFSNTQANAKKEGTVVLRLAEQYLIRAEARAMQDDLSGAIADVDTVRSRAGLPLLSDISPDIAKEPLLAAIMKERMTELFAEFGHRWFDVKRTGQADIIFGARKPGWRTEAALFPIPFKDRQFNPNLGQNPGYE
ncbi:RagB/SusD family nutrient uptake outer membrane protein [Chitinophaga sp. XS-30]|uniref:RagB/SusD family nutrient uptake outer membrane protein n=1 Tax=Chitinophaga sp. XS-30 TaxID=2604421 RepID=UPI0011DDFF4F|nr:RagB/SusD family nutrient uptake outer membrane protein [Chitinophaga sp. XS-30]QEH42558.1 RagB/SusD family nutrient uptake outer membrane protein [Chitinophaga sp. XS-30]